MNRFHWYKIPELSKDQIERLGEVLLRQPFGPKSRAGFRIEEIRDSHIIGQYVEKNEFTQIVEDPLGNRFDLKQLRFETVDFTVADSIPQLECRNPGRNVRDFRNEIAKALNYEIAITRLVFDVAGFVKALAKGTSKAIVTKAVANDIQVSEEAVAQIHLTGSSDVRAALKSFLKGVKHSLVKVRIEATIDGEEVEMEVTAAGSVSFEANPSPRTRHVIRTMVARSVVP